jgi:hypothetical protein
VTIGEQARVLQHLDEADGKEAVEETGGVLMSRRALPPVHSTLTWEATFDVVVLFTARTFIVDCSWTSGSVAVLRSLLPSVLVVVLFVDTVEVDAIVAVQALVSNGGVAFILSLTVLVLSFFLLFLLLTSLGGRLPPAPVHPPICLSLTLLTDSLLHFVFGLTCV